MDTLKITLLVSLGIYFLLMILVSVNSRKNQDPSGFMIANRNLGTLPIVSSLSSFRDGSGIIAWVAFGFTIGYGGLWVMLGALLGLSLYTGFSARIRRSSVEQDAITVGELIRSAVGPITEKLSASLILIFSLVIIAVQLYVAGNLFSEIISIDQWIGMCIVAIIVGTYLTLGGYSAVIKTDVIQFFLILAVILIPVTTLTDRKPLLDISSLYAFPQVDRLAFFLLGFFYVMSSADIWQKLFAARDNTVIKNAFPLSGVLLIFMTLSLIWLGMSAKGLLAGDIESGRIIFELFKQGILPTPLLALLLIVVMAITMSTLDTYCYLFSSSLSRNFLSEKHSESPRNYIATSRRIILSALIVGVILAILMSDVMQTIFNAASLLFILSPLYISLGFGWLKPKPRLDHLLSLSILISISTYIVMLYRGDFADMIMLMVPVLINTILLTAIIIYYRVYNEKAQIHLAR